jgi:hypothetical protein
MGLNDQTRRQWILGLCFIALTVSSVATAAMLFSGTNPPLWLWVELIASYVCAAVLVE